MKSVPILAVVLVVIGVGSLIAGFAYTVYLPRGYSNPTLPGGYQQGMMGQTYLQSASQPAGGAITMDKAKAMAEQYLAALGNSNLAIKEIMEFQNNFYVIYYEKDTQLGAFEMLIWKTTPTGGMMGGGMMGGYAKAGYIMPEPGPNMMWNTKYSAMSNGMMGYGSGYGNQPSSTMTISETKAEQLAQSYLDTNFQNAKTEMGTQFYGYYTFDFTVNGKIAGMLSVNGYTGQVWYHSWHGEFIQEIEFD